MCYSHANIKGVPRESRRLPVENTRLCMTLPSHLTVSRLSELEAAVINAESVPCASMLRLKSSFPLKFIR